MDLYYPFVLPHDAQDGRQPESASRELCGEERVEDPASRLLIHSRTVVQHLQKHILAGRYLLAQITVLQRLVGYTLPASPHQDGALGFNRFSSVDYQVHRDLLHLARIGQEQRQMPVEIQPKLHTGRDRQMNELAGLNDHFRQIQPFQVSPALAGIGQKLPRQVRCALSATDDTAKCRSAGGVLRQCVHQQAGIADDARQQIIKVMSHSGREIADGFHFLRLPQPFICASALGHVLDRQQNTLLPLEPPTEPRTPSRNLSWFGSWAKPPRETGVGGECSSARAPIRR